MLHYKILPIFAVSQVFLHKNLFFIFSFYCYFRVHNTGLASITFQTTIIHYWLVEHAYRIELYIYTKNDGDYIFCPFSFFGHLIEHICENLYFIFITLEHSKAKLYHVLLTIYKSQLQSRQKKNWSTLSTEEHSFWMPANVIPHE